MTMSNQTFDPWLNDVKAALGTINMPLDASQAATPFDFRSEFNAGVAAQSRQEQHDSVFLRFHNERHFK